jgi:hypothetical protein
MLNALHRELKQFEQAYIFSFTSNSAEVEKLNADHQIDILYA